MWLSEIIYLSNLLHHIHYTDFIDHHPGSQQSNVVFRVNRTEDGHVIYHEVDDHVTLDRFVSQLEVM